jgi:hypothetical protein
MLFMTHLFATKAKPTIVLQKTSLVRSKGRLAFLGGIAQSLFVERSSLATQAHKQAVLTTIGLSQSVSELVNLILEILILNH